MHQLRRALVSSLGLLILSTAAHAAIPTTIDLNGQWSLRQSGKDEAVPATVPGNVHTDLLAAGKIPEPFHRDNEEKLQWIGAATWIYSRSFDVPASLLELRNVVLRCEGLDTIAEVRVNGRKAGFADNMFRVWEFDVRELLKPGKNLIEVTFLPAQQWVNDHMTDPAFPGLGSHKTSNLRKEACDFGWDWGPNLATCGIWRNIGLVGWNNARLDGVRINQDLTDKALARLDIDVVVATDGSIPSSPRRLSPSRAGKSPAHRNPCARETAWAARPSRSRTRSSGGRRAWAGRISTRFASPSPMRPERPSARPPSVSAFARSSGWPRRIPARSDSRSTGALSSRREQLDPARHLHLAHHP